MVKTKYFKIMMGKIYIIRNTINNKVYIGKTFQSLTTRFNTHKRDSRKVKNDNRKLYKAIRKYGEDKFSISLLAEDIHESTLSNLEIDYITKYDSYYNGYNNTLGGDGSRYLDVSDIEIINKYKELKVIKLVARYYNICSDTVSTILNNNHIDIIHPAPKKIRINELDMRFNSIRECVNYLKENNYSKASRIDSVYINIKRSIKRKGSFLGFTYSFI